MKLKILYIGMAMLMTGLLLACEEGPKSQPQPSETPELPVLPESPEPPEPPEPPVNPVNIDGYEVPVGRNTIPGEHDNAVYMVFQSSPPPNQEWGIVFMQTEGSFPLAPFVCGGGAWTPSTQSHSCAIESVVEGIQLRETVTVGRLTGHFCDSLRAKHNPESDVSLGGPIMDKSECPVGAGKCTCYEVIHECRLDVSEPYDEGMCPNFAELLTQATSNVGKAPPSRGAGSGRGD